MQCPRCQQENPLPDAQFCPRCGAPVSDTNATEGSHAELRAEIEALRRSLGESLEQQTATSEILRVISQSPTDAQPVFDAIAESATRLCEGLFGCVFRYDGELLHVVGLYHFVPDAVVVMRREYPTRPRGLVRPSVLDSNVVHSPDVFSDPRTASPELARTLGFRSYLGVPMLHDGRPIGAISVFRAEAKPFTETQIALLRTFADQAVIAIENVRLFTELQEKNRALTQAHAQVSEALEQQTATSAILAVISQSPTDVQPVFDAIVSSAERLCHGVWAALYRSDGTSIHLAAIDTSAPEALLNPGALEMFRHSFPIPAGDSSSLVARAMADRRVVNIADVDAVPDLPARARAASLSFGFRSCVFVPLFRDGAVIGAIGLTRHEPNPFTEREIELLQTFADQAVIAIENVRLFTELQTSNRELTTALDTQTATSDILRVISRSQTDVQPVFDTILASAVRLLQGYSGVVTRVGGDQLELAALTRTTDAGDAAVRALYPERLDSQATHVRATRNRAPLNIADAQSDPQLPEVEHTRARVRGYRSHVVVPLLRQDEAIGTIGVTRREPGGFNDDEIALLQIFADQAVIAIENVRLFKELESRNRDLTATSEILQVIAGSPAETQPVFDAIARSAGQLCEGFNVYVILFDGETPRPVALHNVSPDARAVIQRVFPGSPTRSSTWGRAILDRTVVHIPDVTTDPEYGFRDVARADNYRSTLAAPMLREGIPIGAITVARRSPFSEKQIQLVKTFADQAVIAIENVRLFKELREKNQALTQAHAQVTKAFDQQSATGDILRNGPREQSTRYSMTWSARRSSVCGMVSPSALAVLGLITSSKRQPRSE